MRYFRILRKEAKTKGLSFDTRTDRGKGGHMLVYVGDRFTTVKSGEMSPLYVKLVRKQLGL